MSSSPTFTVRQTKGGEEEELLAIDQSRSHTSLPRSRSSSRLEILMMDLVRSQTEIACSTEQKLESLARSQSEQLTELAKGQADLASAQRGHAAEMANMMGRISSVERSLHGTPSPSPIPGRRGSSPSAETINVSVPTTSGSLVPLSQSQLRRSERLLLKPRPDYRLLNRSAIWQDRSIPEVDEDAEYGDPTSMRRETQRMTVAGEMTLRRGPGDIVSS